MKQVKTLAQVEDALFEIAELDLGISKASKEAEEIINRAKAEAEKVSRDLIKRRDDLVELIEKFSDKNRDTIYTDGKKSIKLTNGTIGYRAGAEKIEVSEETAELLEKAGFGHCVQVKKTPIKASLKGFSNDQLKQFKATRIDGQESFYVKASEDCVKSTSKGVA